MINSEQNVKNAQNSFNYKTDDLSTFLFWYKFKKFSKTNITMIAISNWLKKRMLESPIFKGKNRHCGIRFEIQKILKYLT